jgi:hypothetical protein
MMTEMPGRPRSVQLRMAFGLPLRTRITLTEAVGALWSGRRLAQSAGTRPPRSARMSMSLSWFIVMTSASRPSITLRACLLEPPWDWRRSSTWPVVLSQWAAKAAL